MAPTTIFARNLMFKSLKLYANPKGIPKIKLQLLLKRFTDNGGELVKKDESNVILSLKPLESDHGIIIGPDYISDSILAGSMLPLPKKRIVEKPKRRNSSEDDDLIEIQPKKRINLCMKSSPIKAEAGYNELILHELEKLLERYTAQGDRWRIFSYRKAIRAIKDYEKPLRSGKEAGLLQGVGKKIADKIDEIIATGTLAKNNFVPEEF